jgi:phage recombination protein Bet
VAGYSPGGNGRREEKGIVSNLSVLTNENPEWETKLELIKKTVANGATNDELELFLYQAKRSGLDPLARQIYFVKRKGRGTIQVGIDGLRLVAERSGNYAGSDDAELAGMTEQGYPESAKVTVYKMVQGQRCAFSATARWGEYYPGDEQGFQWRKMPCVMLSKCAEALALRKAFPADLSGLYVHEEMDQAGKDEAPMGGVDKVFGKVAGEFVKSIMSADEFKDLKAFCEGRSLDWIQFALEAKEAGVTTTAQLYAYADGESPEIAGEVVDAQ